MNGKCCLRIEYMHVRPLATYRGARDPCPTIVLTARLRLIRDNASAAPIWRGEGIEHAHIQ